MNRDKRLMKQVIRLSAPFGLLMLLALDLAANAVVGEQIYQHCKVCHGVNGHGGEDGKYPRIAGLPQAYLEKQLADFKNRKRLNKPMVPVFKNWRFNQQAISSVATYVSRLSLAELTIPEYQPAVELTEQFDDPEQMHEVGEEIFQDCIQCHGERGSGREDKGSPPLVHQYPNYLSKQIGDFASGRREHENSESLFAELVADEIAALLLFLEALVRNP